MNNYIDGFAMPIPTAYLHEYKAAATTVANIWKEYGALEYFEYIGDDMVLEGTKSFSECLDAHKDETIIFGWVVFPSREIRDLANKKVAADPRMEGLISPLMDPTKMVFDAKRMAYGGFQSFIG